VSTRRAVETTEVAVLTAAGRSAKAVLAVKGPQATAAVDSYFVAANRRRLDEQPLGRIVYGRWGDEAGEDLIVCRQAADQVEIHCHGSRPSIEQIVQQLTAAGCSQVAWR
jgi:tRNA U34 5-carboxymethylaminomethyl modifying GTPase MnmE/TrmE